MPKDTTMTCDLELWHNMELHVMRNSFKLGMCTLLSSLCYSRQIEAIRRAELDSLLRYTSSRLSSVHVREGPSVEPSAASSLCE